MLRIIVFTFFVFLYSLGTSHSVERIALIVGNSAYTHVSALKNPNNDAELMSTTLESVGFDVTVVSDADLPSFRKALTEFGRKLRNSDAVGLFYYAGHGVQMDGENFLIPVDANVQDETELSWQALRVNDVLRVMRRDSNAVNIVILDACRNNPFPGNTRSNTRGLAQIEAASGSYIAYATAPGDVALDGDSGNSPYTLALASAMSVPGLTIEETFKTARQDVLKSTNGKQIPWEASSITGMFHFTDPDQESIGALQAKLREQQALIASLKQQQEDVASSSVLSTENQASGEACNSLATSKEDRSVLSGESVDYTQLRKHAHDAVAACKRAVEAFPKDDRYKYQLARSYLAMGDKDVDAAHWMRKAAEGYYPVAMNGLGVLLNHGRGVATDNEEAFKWITRAAEKGNVPAMTNLGVAFTGAVGTDSRQQEGYDWFLKAVSNGDKRGTIMLASMYAGNNQVLVNYNVKQNLKLAERLIIDNGLSDAIGAARILSHTYGDWPAKMAIKNNRDKEFYWNKSHQWRLRAIERNDRISIIQGDGKDGYIDDIETLLDAIIKVSTIPHPVDRPEQEKLYFVRAYDDNLYVVYDWNRELLTSKKQYGYDVDVNLHAKIDEAYTKIVNAKRVFNF